MGAHPYKRKHGKKLKGHESSIHSYSLDDQHWQHAICRNKLTQTSRHWQTGPRAAQAEQGKSAGMHSSHSCLLSIALQSAELTCSGEMPRPSQQQLSIPPCPLLTPCQTRGSSRAALRS